MACFNYNIPSIKTYVNMKNFNQIIILLLLSFYLVGCNTAEKVYYDYKDARAESILVSENNGVTIYNNRSLADNKSKVRLMPTKFTGYSFLLTIEGEPLNINHNYFRQFGGIMMYKTVLDEYAYYLGAFRTLEEINAFYDTTLKDRLPEAIIIRFEKGRTMGF